MLHQSWTSFSGDNETHELHAQQHHPPGNVLAAPVGFKLSDLQESSTLVLSSVAHGIASRFGDAVDYFHSGDQGILPLESSETLQEDQETSPRGSWKEYISNQVNRIRLDGLPSVPSMETFSDTDRGFCKEVHELPV